MVSQEYKKSKRKLKFGFLRRPEKKDLDKGWWSLGSAPGHLRLEPGRERERAVKIFFKFLDSLLLKGTPIMEGTNAYIDKKIKCKNRK